ncbi:3-deoxy-manno-octulosonate cytidylyltransferase [Elongatibacter sediminis]|uniref:3-deoxy-manno-octulosonate cytidylyltransferase n=1 Tax=Elongatibacter sediminis TaxID=3119006 RepID=A0AAW9RJN8_9GAMM
MTARYHIVIPARMASERLPGKPLADIAGQPLVQHVYRRACAASAETVIIATDDERIASAAGVFGGEALMTSAAHQSGTDRIAECAALSGWPDDALVVNLQGDEPLMPPECLDQVAGLLADDSGASMASLWWPLQDEAEIADPNVVKVVTAADGSALFFSRSVLPFPRAWGDVSQALRAGQTWKRHVGLYAYRVGALREFAARPPSPLEIAERLEQLRVLESGGRIAMARACRPIPAGVDTEADLERVRGQLS